MEKELILAKRKLLDEQINDYLKASICLVKMAAFMNPYEKETFIKGLKKMDDDSVHLAVLATGISILNRCQAETASKLLKELDDWKENGAIKGYIRSIQERRNISSDSLIDSDPISFNGDIIITDPCYIISKEDIGLDFRSSKFHSKMKSLGISTYLLNETLSSDWNCKIRNPYTDEEYGKAHSDSGLISVLLLDEALKCNPSFDRHINEEWTTTWIKGFNGTVQIVIEKIEGVHLPCGKDCAENDEAKYQVKVFGNGHNTKTGEPVTFITDSE